ncbi:MAG TPA: Dam family site-specific DNA-(adenine-N6)-methyltransferase [Gammaproteobacteria bacterium]|nr:Dam family site-specific DNA-(adenine-N6)-methyltransferase [Gammaproteobacteria bacterium]
MNRAASRRTQSSPGNGRDFVALKPPLKWAGGKRWLVPRLADLWRRHRNRRLIEPFCGGLAVALGLAPKRALLNDVNPHPVNFYRHLQAGLRIRIPMRNESALYYRHRSEFNRLVTGRGLETRKAAELFYYLNRTGYNGLCRFNRKGEFNVPFGHHKGINYIRDFDAYREPLSGWRFENLDFEKLPAESSDFIYADPPYDVPFTQYAKNGFGWGEQERLALWLSRHRGPVVLSNQATERVVQLYRRLGFRLSFVDAPRMISCTGDRSPAREVIATRGL